VLYAFWPVKKQQSPLLPEVDLDYTDTQLRIRSEASKTVNSDLSDESLHSPSKASV